MTYPSYLSYAIHIDRMVYNTVLTVRQQSNMFPFLFLRRNFEETSTNLTRQHTCVNIMKPSVKCSFRMRIMKGEEGKTMLSQDFSSDLNIYILT